MAKDFPNDCFPKLITAGVVLIGVVLVMGGKPSKGTRKDKRLKENKVVKRGGK